jgi:hypothetical protein
MQNKQFGLSEIMLRAFVLTLSYCSVVNAQGAVEPIWPTKQWQTSTPEEQGMDSAAQSLRNPVGARPLPPGILETLSEIEWAHPNF